MYQKNSNKIKNTLKQNGSSVLNSIVLKENQLAYLLKNEENGQRAIDYVMGNPLIYLMMKDQKNKNEQENDQVIQYINFRQQKFYFYDFNALSKNLNIEKNRLKKLLIYTMMFFIAQKNFNQNKIIYSIYKSQNIFQNYNDLMNQDYEFIEQKIKNLNQQDIDFSRYKKACEFLQTNFFSDNQFSAQQTFNYFFQIPVFNLDIKIKYYPQSKPITKMNYSPSIIQHKQLCMFWFLDYLEEPVVHFLNNQYQNTYYINPLVNYTQEFHQLLCTKLIKQFQISLENILLVLKEKFGNDKQITNLIENKNYALNYCGKRYQLDVNLNYKKNLNTLFIDQKNTSDDYRRISISTILNILKNKKNHKCQLITLDQDDYLSKNQIQKYLNLKLLETLQYINIEKQNLTPLGNLFLNCFNRNLNQDFIVFFEALSSNLLNTDAFLQQIQCNNNFSQQGNIIFQGFEEIEQTNQLENPQQDFKNKYISCQVIATSFSITQQILQAERKLISNKIWEMVRQQIHQKFDEIILISKIAIITNKSLIFEKYKDESCNQFALTIDQIQLSLRQLQKTEMIYLFCKTNMIQDLDFLNDSLKNIQFYQTMDGSVGAFIQNILIRFLVVIRLEDISMDKIIKKIKDLDLKKNKELDFKKNKESNVMDYNVQNMFQNIKIFLEVLQKIKKSQNFQKNSKDYSNYLNDLQIVPSALNLWQDFMNYIFQNKQ